MTSANAGFAAAALVEVHFEGVLLARRGWRGRQQVAVKAVANFAGLVGAGKCFNGSELTLLDEEIVNQRSRRVRFRFAQHAAKSTRAFSKIRGELNIDIICIPRPQGRIREGLLDVLPEEKMPVA